MSYTEGDSFTTITDVEAYCNRGSFTDDTVPTTTQIYGFMASVAASLTLTINVYGLNYTVPSGSNPIPSGPLATVLGQMNAVGAAIQTISAYETGQAPAQSEKVKELLDLYKELDANLNVLLEKGCKAGLWKSSTVGVASSVTTGGITPITFPPADEPGPHLPTFSRTRRDW